MHRYLYVRAHISKTPLYILVSQALNIEAIELSSGNINIWICWKKHKKTPCLYHLWLWNKTPKCEQLFYAEIGTDKKHSLLQGSNLGDKKCCVKSTAP